MQYVDKAKAALAETMERHGRAALMFSGGKDSLAVLELARPHWGELAVVWVDTGAQLPEIHALMDRFKKELPYLFVVMTDQPKQNAEHGYPVDILPVWNTTLGQSIGGEKSIKLQNWMDCCNANIWQPSIEFIRTLGVTALIRGQRADERFTAPTRNGDVLEGIELVYPIQDWTRDETLEFLAGRGYEIDERLLLGHSSLDCSTCTAFVAATPDRLVYLSKYHPQEAKEVYAALQQIAVVVQEEVDAITKTLESVR